MVAYLGELLEQMTTPSGPRFVKRNWRRGMNLTIQKSTHNASDYRKCVETELQELKTKSTQNVKRLIKALNCGDGMLL